MDNEIYSSVNGIIKDYDVLKNKPKLNGVDIQGELSETPDFFDKEPVNGSKKFISSGGIKEALDRKSDAEHEHDERYYTESESDLLMNAHNTANSSHQDIRILLSELRERLNAIADSDDLTLDQLSEIVAYIKNNKDLIDAVTTQKINYSDIVANLETNVADKPLSASMGVALKALVDENTAPTKVSELTNDLGFMKETEIEQRLKEKQDKISEFVSSVNGKSGVVELNAVDVHALPDSTIIPTVPENVSAFKNDAGYLTEHQSLEEYPKRTESEKYTDEGISKHNTSEFSHQDIRLLIQGLSDRINAVADSDDTTLDQLSEIVTYIKSNKELIDAITTQKISYSDIVANLETNVADKPLSASMGVVLKSLIDAITVPAKVSDLSDADDYVKETELKDALSEVEKPFAVTATVYFGAANRLTNVSKTLEEIYEAYIRSDHIFLDADLSQMLPGQRAMFNLVSLLPGQLAVFEGIVSMETSTHVTAILFSDNTSLVEISPLVKTSATGGLTFTVTDTVPTVDDRSVITFVLEE